MPQGTVRIPITGAEFYTTREKHESFSTYLHYVVSSFIIFHVVLCLRCLRLSREEPDMNTELWRIEHVWYFHRRKPHTD